MTTNDLSNSFSIQIRGSVLKHLDTLPKIVRNKLLEKVDELALNEKSLQPKKVSGTNNVYRIRSGNYRIIYRKQMNKIIIVVLAAHRKHVYKLLKKISL